jgi:septal ring factor EnvC (AmiA/AmiB activator)
VNTLSAFTKILTVLLSLASIFLCGLVVSYVANTNNVKGQYDKLQSDYKVLQSSKNVATARANEIQMEADKQIAELKDKLASMEEEKNQLVIDLTNAEHTAVKWQDRVNSWAGVVKSFEQTIAEMEQSLQATRGMLSQEQSENIKLGGQLNEMATSLDEHIVMLNALKAEKRRLQEQLVAVEQQAEKAAGNVVTPVQSRARAASEPSGYSNITGLVEEVSKNLVSISVGSSDGVKEGMKFHVTSGTTFIADIVITDVDTDVSAGVIELKSGQPQAGDTVSNTL